MNHQNEFKELLEKEAKFWAHFNEDALQKGIPHWLDLQNATPIKRRPYNPFNDCRIEKIIRGDIKKEFLESAGNPKVKKEKKALDFGCGMGWLSLELSRKGFEVDGFDLAEKSIKIAKKYSKKMGEKINYQVADLNNFQFKENFYDVVAVWDVLHHLVNPEEVLKRLKNSLKPGGKILILDHLGFDEKNEKTVKILMNILPAKLSHIIYRFKRKFKIENKKKQIQIIEDAPFEHCSENKILPAIKKILKGSKIKERLPIAIHLAHHHEVPDFLTEFIWKLVKNIDNKMLKNGAKGEYISVIWMKDIK
tara:strand:- start:3 stop:923 length:921 start_codon:yes stop_codon:yes gene_type:complete